MRDRARGEVGDGGVKVCEDLASRDLAGSPVANFSLLERKVTNSIKRKRRRQYRGHLKGRSSGNKDGLCGACVAVKQTRRTYQRRSVKEVTNISPQESTGTIPNPLRASTKPPRAYHEQTGRTSKAVELRGFFMIVTNLGFPAPFTVVAQFIVPGSPRVVQLF